MAEPTAPPAETPPAKSESYLDVIEKAFAESQKPKPAEPAKVEVAKVEPPPESPKTETGDPNDAPEPPGLSAPAVSNWKKLKQERNEWSQKAKAAQAELEAERAKPRPDPREIETIKKERDEYSNRLQQLDVERHPKFQQYFEQKTTATLGLAKTIVGDANAPRFQAALEMPDGQFRDNALEEIISELKPIQQSRLGAVVVDYDKIRQERSQHVAESRANWQRLQEDGQRKQQENQTQYLKAFDDQMTMATDPKSGLPVFQKRSGTTAEDIAWNAQVDASVATARDIYQGKRDAPEIAKAALWAASAPLFLAELRGRDTTITALTKRISELEAAKPVLINGNPAPTGGEDKYKGMSYADRMVQMAMDAAGR